MAEKKYSKEQVDQYIEYVKSQQASKLTPEQMGRYESYIREQMPVDEPGLGSKALDYGLRGLDYLGGLARGTVAGGAELVTGQDDLVNIEDVLRGKAPTSSDVMEKLGVSEMGALSEAIPGAYSETGNEWLKLKKGGLLDPTGRGAIGLGADIALDPLTYLTLGGSAVAKAGKAGKVAEKVLRPVSNISESAGKSMYKSGLKRIDQEAFKYGKEPVSDTLMKYGISGSAESIYKQMDDLAETLVGQQKAILERATEAGGKANMSQAMQGTVDKIAELRATRDPALQPVADALEAEVKRYSQLDPKLIDVPTGRMKSVPTKPEKIPTGDYELRGYDLVQSMAEASPLKYAPEMKQVMTPPINPEQASKMKTSLYETLPRGTYQEMVTTAMGVSPQLTKGKRTMAQGLKTETEEAVGRVLGAGEQAKLVDVNKELGQILTSKDKQMAEAFKEANKNAFTSVDAVLAASQIPKDNANWWLLGLKKAADIAKATGPRTNTGKALYKFGTSGAPASAADIYLRRNLINEQGE